MKLIIRAEEGEWISAIHAVKVFLGNGESNSAIIAHIDGTKFLVTKNKTSITVRGEV